MTRGPGTHAPAPSPQSVPIQLLVQVTSLHAEFLGRAFDVALVAFEAQSDEEGFGLDLELFEGGGLEEVLAGGAGALTRSGEAWAVGQDLFDVRGLDKGLKFILSTEIPFAEVVTRQLVHLYK